MSKPKKNRSRENKAKTARKDGAAAPKRIAVEKKKAKTARKDGAAAPKRRGGKPTMKAPAHEEEAQQKRHGATLTSEWRVAFV